MTRLTRKNYAHHKGVNPSTVTRWIKRGRIEVDAQGLIDVVQAERRLAETESHEPHHQARLAQIAADKQNEMPAPGLDDGKDREERDSIALRHKLAMTREREAKAELAAMELDREAGLLLERADIEFSAQDLALQFRTRLESMPDVLSSEIASLAGDVGAIHDRLEQYTHDLLRELSEGFAKLADGSQRGDGS